MNVHERVYINAKKDGRGGWLAMSSPTAATVQRAGTVMAVNATKGTVTVRFDDSGLTSDMKTEFVHAHAVAAPDRIAGLKRVVFAEVKALGELAAAGIRESDFARYDAQQDRVAGAKADLRKAMGIVDPIPECAHCRRSVDRDTEALEFFADNITLHKHCAADLRAEGELPALWYSDCNGLDTFNQVAITNGDQTIVLADLTQFENSQKSADLWKSACAFADAYAAALNFTPEEN